jgi:hypothetical protein
VRLFGPGPVIVRAGSDAAKLGRRELPASPPPSAARLVTPPAATVNVAGSPPPRDVVKAINDSIAKTVAADPGGGGRWGRLAERLGLTLVEGGGLLSRRRPALVGRRNDYLVAVSPSHSLNESSVDLLVRYPRNSTIRGMREDLLEDPALAAAFGRKGRVPRSRRKDLLLGDGLLLLRLPYAVVTPSAGLMPNRIGRCTSTTAVSTYPDGGNGRLPWFVTRSSTCGSTP